MLRESAVLVLVVWGVAAAGLRPGHALQTEVQGAIPGEPQGGAGRHGEDISGLLEAARTAELAGDHATRKARLDEAFRLAGTGNIELNRMRGLVFEKGCWLSAAEVAELSARDPALVAYRSMRQQAPDTLDGNVGLAAWCRANGLPEQARAHLLRALTFDMENDRVRQLLGHRNIGGRWMTPEQLAEDQTEAVAARERFELHRAAIEEIARLLDSPRKKNRDQGFARLAAIDDPAMVTAIEIILAPLSEPIAAAVVDKVAGFSESEATGALLRQAISSPWPAVRDQAASRLGQRDKYDYVPTLMSMLAGPAVSQFSIVSNRAGNLFYQHTIAQQTAEADEIRQSDRSYFVNPGADRGQVADTRDFLVAANAAGREANRREKELQQYNRKVAEQNAIVIGLLHRALELDLGNDPAAWWAWWHEENEVYVQQRPVSYREQSQNFIRSDRDRPMERFLRNILSHECLVAGTPVWTESGLVAIETLGVGDRVLARDTESGVNGFRVVIRPTVRPASPTLRIRVGDDTIQASGGHPFWVNGTGWVKARELKPKMLLQTIEGPAEIVAIEPGETVELYNLVVDGDSTYFVGEQGVLSHDNTIPSRGSRSIQNQKTR